MTVIINGEIHERQEQTLATLLSALDYEGEWLATAVNGEIVHREERAEYRLCDGDRIEILTPMQGG